MAQQILITFEGSDAVSGVAKKIGESFGGLGQKADQVGTQTAKSGGRMSSAMGKVGLAVGGVAAGIGGGLVIAAGAGAVALGKFTSDGIANAISLEQQMANIASVMGETAESVAPLNDLILDLGVDPGLKVSTFEAAEAVELLARNGLDMTQIMDGAAKASIQLANATGADFGGAADVATDVMSLFNIEAANMSDAVDGITSVVNNSKFGFDDYRLALAQGGGVAAAVGVEFDDFNTAIAAISPSFASGSDAGTSFKTFLQSLTGKSGPAKDAMADLGLLTMDTSAAFQFLSDKGFAPASQSMADIETAFQDFGAEMGLSKTQIGELSDSLITSQNAFFDSQGNLKDMAEISGILQNATAGLSEEQMNQAFSTIFGTDAMRAAFGMAQIGEDAFKELKATMGETSAEDAVNTRMNTLSGQMEILSGTVEALGIKLGQAFLPLLKQVASGVQSFVDEHGAGFVAWASEMVEWIGATLPPILARFSAFMSENLPVAIAFLSDTWTNTLLPALNAFVEFMRTYIVPVVLAIADLLSSYLGGQIKILAAIWTNVLQPAVALFANFISSTFKTIMDELGISFGTDGVAGSISTFAEFIDQILVPAVVGFVEWAGASLIPMLETMFDWLSANLPGAIQTLQDAWENNIGPALEAVWKFIDKSVIPILIDLGYLLATTLPPILNKMAEIWQDVLLPALTAVTNFVINDLLPWFKSLQEFFDTAMSISVGDISNMFELTLTAALTAAKEAVQPLIDKFTSFKSFLDTTMKTGIENFNSLIDGIGTTFNNLLTPIQALWDKLADFKAYWDGLSFGDILPSIPSPFSSRTKDSGELLDTGRSSGLSTSGLIDSDVSPVRTELARGDVYYINNNQQVNLVLHSSSTREDLEGDLMTLYARLAAT